MNKFRRKNAVKNELPDSIEGIKKIYEKKAVQWYSRQGVVMRILVAVIILLILFITARFGLLGQKQLEISGKFLPIHIPFIDAEIRIIPLSLTYEIEDASGNQRTGKNDDQCCTGDKITISFKAGSDCNVLIIGIDSKNVYSVFGEQFTAEGIIKNEVYTTNTFKLDTITGAEAYYLLACVEKLDFINDIKPEIERIKNLAGKGAIFSDFDLKLRRNIYYKYVNFRHGNCNRR